MCSAYPAGTFAVAIPLIVEEDRGVLRPATVEGKAARYLCRVPERCRGAFELDGRPGHRSAAARSLEADEVAIGVRNEGLLHPGFIVSDAVPLRFGLHEEVDTGICESGDQWRDAGYIDLKVDSSTEGGLEWASDPVPTDSDLLQHEMGGAERYIREALLGSRVTNLETAQIAPEGKAAIDVADQELGDERRFKGFSHQTTLAPNETLRPDLARSSCRHFQ